MRAGDLASAGGGAVGQTAGQVMKLGADVDPELRVEDSCGVRPTDGNRSHENGPSVRADPESARGGAEPGRPVPRGLSPTGRPGAAAHSVARALESQ